MIDDGTIKNPRKHYTGYQSYNIMMDANRLRNVLLVVTCGPVRLHVPLHFSDVPSSHFSENVSQ
jgi:hypothetical protein